MLLSSLSFLYGIVSVNVFVAGTKRGHPESEHTINVDFGDKKIRTTQGADRVVRVQQVMPEVTKVIDPWKPEYNYLNVFMQLVAFVPRPPATNLTKAQVRARGLQALKAAVQILVHSHSFPERETVQKSWSVENLLRQPLVGERYENVHEQSKTGDLYEHAIVFIWGALVGDDPMSILDALTVTLNIAGSFARLKMALADFHHKMNTADPFADHIVTPVAWEFIRQIMISHSEQPLSMVQKLNWNAYALTLAPTKLDTIGSNLRTFLEENDEDVKREEKGSIDRSELARIKALVIKQITNSWAPLLGSIDFEGNISEKELIYLSLWISCSGADPNLDEFLLKKAIHLKEEPLVNLVFDTRTPHAVLAAFWQKYSDHLQASTAAISVVVRDTHSLAIKSLANVIFQVSKPSTPILPVTPQVNQNSPIVQQYSQEERRIHTPPPTRPASSQPEVTIPVVTNSSYTSAGKRRRSSSDMEDVPVKTARIETSSPLPPPIREPSEAPMTEMNLDYDEPEVIVTKEQAAQPTVVTKSTKGTKRVALKDTRTKQKPDKQAQQQAVRRNERIRAQNEARGVGREQSTTSPDFVPALAINWKDVPDRFMRRCQVNPKLATPQALYATLHYVKMYSRREAFAQHFGEGKWEALVEAVEKGRYNDQERVDLMLNLMAYLREFDTNTPREFIRLVYKGAKTESEIVSQHSKLA